MYAVQKGLALQKSKAEFDFLKNIIQWLEGIYQALKNQKVGLISSLLSCCIII